MERECSNSLLHIDWYKIRDPWWKSLWLTVYKDDSSKY